MLTEHPKTWGDATEQYSFDLRKSAAATWFIFIIFLFNTFLFPLQFHLFNIWGICLQNKLRIKNRLQIDDPQWLEVICQVNFCFLIIVNLGYIIQTIVILSAVNTFINECNFCTHDLHFEIVLCIQLLFGLIITELIISKQRERLLVACCFQY